MTTTQQPDWRAPGEGPWEFDASHFGRPLPLYASELFCDGFSRGQAESFERTGVPMKGIAARLVNGLPYVQMVPLLGKASDAYRAPPPAWLFALVGWLHPTMRRRIKTMNAWFARRAWREDLRTWDEELKPQLRARFSELQAEDVAGLSDAALVEHLGRCGGAFVDNLIAHFHTNPTTIFPVGLFVHRAIEWSGCAPLEVLTLLDAHDAPPSGEREVLDAWARAAQADATVGRALADTSTPAADRLADLRGRDDGVGEATRAWFETVAYRQVAAGDLANPIGIEVPAALLGRLESALAGATQKPPSHDERAFWSRVPAAHREALEALLAEARLVYRLRDERSGELDAWIGGLVRRALLEAGARLVKAGRLEDAADVVDVATNELPGLLLRGEGPSAEAVHRRVELRGRVRVEDAPRVLGADFPPPPPPAHLFKGVMGDLLAAITTYRALMEDSAPAPETAADDVLEGLAASGGRYTGRARICTEPSHFETVQPGDILVARATMPAYNVLLPIVGAVVTDRGGALCHAAIVSREYGLPCVVGTRDATARISDGDIVTVDGDRGRVQIARKSLERAS